MQLYMRMNQTYRDRRLSHIRTSDMLRGVKLIRLKAGKVVTLSASNFMDYLAGSMQARES